MVAGSFYEQPILNSPYEIPTLHHPLDDHGQPLDQPPVRGRRPSKFVVPVPKSRKKASAAQGMLDLESYTENALINEIRSSVGASILWASPLGPLRFDSSLEAESAQSAPRPQRSGGLEAAP